MKLSRFALATFLLVEGLSMCNGQDSPCSSKCPGERTTVTTKAALQNSIEKLSSVAGPDWLAIECLDVGQVENMEGLFGILGDRLPSLDLRCWDVSRVTTMKEMFDGATSFNGNIDYWDTSSVKDMSSMFSGATEFNRNLQDWDTSKVANMSSMFSGATNFIAYYINYYTSKVDVGIKEWDTSKVEDMSSMFSGATTFNINLYWNTSSVTDMSSMFSGATKFNGWLRTDTGWNTAKVTDMSSMFSETLYGGLLDWDTSSVTDMSSMFYGNTHFNSAMGHAMGRWNTSSVKDMSSMFSGATGFNYPLDSWDVSEVTDMSSMFSGATSFNYLLTWDVSSVKDMSSMFFGATEFIGSGIDDWNTTNVEDMSSMFSGATSFNAHIAQWDTSKVTSMASMFVGASQVALEWRKWGSGAFGSPEKFDKFELRNHKLVGVDKNVHIPSFSESALKAFVLFEYLRKPDGSGLDYELKWDLQIGNCNDASSTAGAEIPQDNLPSIWQVDDGDKKVYYATEQSSGEEIMLRPNAAKAGVQVGKVPFQLVQSGPHCLRIFYQHFGTVVSHLHYEITVTKEGKFTGVTVDVDSSSASVDAEVKEEEDVTATVCGDQTIFKVGQEFSICVGTPGNDVISSFKNVICKNGAFEKKLFDEAGVIVDLLTSFDLEAKKFTSVVTTGLVEGNNNQFECTGHVVLKRARVRRDLQASEENAEDLFSVQIPIAARSDGVDALGIAAPGVAVGPLAVGTAGAIALAAALL